MTSGDYTLNFTLASGTCGPGDALTESVVIDFQGSPPIAFTSVGTLDPNPTINGCEIRYGYTVSNQGLCSEAESHVTFDLTGSPATGELHGTATVSSCATQDGGALTPCSGTYTVLATK